MADKYVGDLTTATPNLTDKLLGVNGSDAYQALVSDVAKKIIEDYAGTTLMGTAQSIASAFNGSNSLVAKNNIVGANMRQGWIALSNGQDLNTIVEVGVYIANTDPIAASLLNCPISNYFRMKVINYISGGNPPNYIKQIIRRDAPTNGFTMEYYERVTANRGSTWSEWRKGFVRAEADALANLGRKNLCLPMFDITTLRGLAVTRNRDGSFTLNGTSDNTSATWSTISSAFTLPAGYYILSGDAEDSPIYMRGRTAAGTWLKGTFSLSQPTEMTLTLYFPANAVVNNATYYPMIRPAAIQDDTYVPYGYSNAELSYSITTNIPLTYGGITSTACFLYRYGKLRILKVELGDGTAFTNLTGTDVVATLDETDRPPGTFSNTLTARDNGAWATSNYYSPTIFIASSGDLTIRGKKTDMESCKYLTGTLVWRVT